MFNSFLCIQSVIILSLCVFVKLIQFVINEYYANHLLSFRKDKLTRHEKLHIGGRAHTCSECPTSFARKEELTKHVQFHHFSPDLVSFIFYLLIDYTRTYVKINLGICFTLDVNMYVLSNSIFITLN